VRVFLFCVVVAENSTRFSEVVARLNFFLCVVEVAFNEGAQKFGNDCLIAVHFSQ